MIEIRTVTTKRETERFIDFRTELYKDDPCAVPYLFMGERDDLDQKKNPAFDFSEAEYYMAYKDGKEVGRVAAIINNKAKDAIELLKGYTAEQVEENMKADAQLLHQYGIGEAEKAIILSAIQQSNVP